MYHVAGIDPGKKGGFAIFNRKPAFFVYAGALLFDNPGALFETLQEYDVQEILIERAQSAREQANQFEYGRGFGRMETACMMTNAKIYYTAPAWWKGKLNVPVDKNRAMEKALKLFPGLEKHVTLKKHEGIAEAALIASVLTDRELTTQLVKNNANRERAAASKRKRPSFRL